MNATSPMYRVLDLARWAPSGDNTQPWRFEIVDDHHVVVHGFDTRDHCVYDLDGHASQISLGALLQTMEIAATTEGWAMSWQRRLDLPETTPTFDVQFRPGRTGGPDPLAAFIEKRSVQRRALRTRPLTGLEKGALEAAVGPGYWVVWLEGWRTKWSAALLMFRNAKLRLTMPEAYEVHRSIIDWGQRYSADKVPDQALGADPLTLKLMRFVLGSWPRVQFFNRFLAGTWAPRIQMDLIPSLACAGHAAICAVKPPATVDDWVDGGRTVQRFWLTATRLGLWHQPEITPLVFSNYVREGRSFTGASGIQRRAQELSRSLNTLIDGSETRCVWMGRIGAGRAPIGRSIRQPISQLIVPKGHFARKAEGELDS